MAVVVLPTPPFWFAIAMTLAKRRPPDILGSGAHGALRDRGQSSTGGACAGRRVIHSIAKLFTESVDICAR
jgi:hypothetical protein